MKNALTDQELTNEEIQEVSELAHNQLRLEREISEIQQQLDRKSEQLKSLSEVQIPDAMMALGISELKLSTGESVSIKKFYSCRIPDERGQEAIQWLRSTGNDDIIKNTITMNFGKGDDSLAAEVASELTKRGLAPEQRIFVHPMTLKSFVKERIENAREIPLDLFGVFVGNKTKITPGK